MRRAATVGAVAGTLLSLLFAPTGRADQLSNTYDLMSPSAKVISQKVDRWLKAGGMRPRPRATICRLMRPGRDTARWTCYAVVRVPDTMVADVAVLARKTPIGRVALKMRIRGYV